LKRIKYQALIKQAGAEPDRDAFIAAHQCPAIPASWCGNIWDVAHTSVREIVYHTGLSQVEFADSIGVQVQNVNNWCSAKNSRNCMEALRLALAEMAGIVEVPLEW